MKALVLSGGGVKGAFQVGVLRHLIESEGVDYDIYAGISVGALNSAKLAEGPLSETLPELEDIWLNKLTGNSSVWKHRLWPYILISICVILAFVVGGFVSFILSAPKWLTIIFAILAIGAFYIPYHALTHTHSIYTTEPLRNLIEDNIDIEKLKESNKQLRIGAVSFTTGEYRSVNEHVDDVVDWIMASSAFPIFFPRVEIMGQYWTDGGVTDIAPLSDALNAGATEIDIILTTSIKSGYYHGLPGITKQLMRDVELMSSEILRNDLNARSSIHDGVKIRIFMPKGPLTSNPLEFDPNRIKRMYQEGQLIAENALKNQ